MFPQRNPFNDEVQRRKIPSLLNQSRNGGGNPRGTVISLFFAVVPNIQTNFRTFRLARCSRCFQRTFVLCLGRMEIKEKRAVTATKNNEKTTTISKTNNYNKKNIYNNITTPLTTSPTPTPAPTPKTKRFFL